MQAEYWDTYDYVNETNTMVAEIERANRVHKLHVTLKLNESSDQGTIHNCRHSKGARVEGRGYLKKDNYRPLIM